MFQVAESIGFKGDFRQWGNQKGKTKRGQPFNVAVFDLSALQVVTNSSEIQPGRAACAQAQDSGANYSKDMPQSADEPP